MIFGKRTYGILGLVDISAIVAVGTTLAFKTTESEVPPGTIDDGIELLDQASISLDEAIAAAQAAYSGALGEVDLEDYQGQLVFNIDIGDKDVKVDAANGAVLGFESDDSGGQD